MIIRLLVSLLVAVLVTASIESVSAQAPWQAEWDKTVRAAESEGQLTLYGCCYDYDRVLEGFKKKYPKLKVALMLSGGNQLATRILAERRGEKYLVDVVSSGANTLHDALYKAQALNPIKPALIVPEVSINRNGTTASTAISIRKGATFSFSTPTRSPAKLPIISST